MMKNYLDLGRFLLIYQRFVFLDTEDYLADQLFIRHRVRVRVPVRAQVRERRLIRGRKPENL